jgi:hypothetical protein
LLRLLNSTLAAISPLGVLLVDRLPRQPQRFGDLRPAPARLHGLLDGAVLELISQAAKRTHGGQPVSDFVPTLEAWQQAYRQH